MAGRVYRQFVLLLGKLFLARIWVHRLTLIFHHTCLLGYKIGMLIPGKFPRWEMNFPGLDRDLKWRRQHRQRSMCYQQLTSASAVELKSHWHMKCGLITRRHNAVPPPQLSSVHTWQAELLVWPCMVATSNMSAWCTHAHTALSNATEDQVWQCMSAQYHRRLVSHNKSSVCRPPVPRSAQPGLYTERLTEC